MVTVQSIGFIYPNKFTYLNTFLTQLSHWFSDNGGPTVYPIKWLNAYGDYKAAWPFCFIFTHRAALQIWKALLQSTQLLQKLLLNMYPSYYLQQCGHSTTHYKQRTIWEEPTQLIQALHKLQQHSFKNPLWVTWPCSQNGRDELYIVYTTLCAHWRACLLTLAALFLLVERFLHLWIQHHDGKHASRHKDIKYRQPFVKQ